MIDTYKNVIRYQIEPDVYDVKHICKQRDFLANGADLIDGRET